MPTSTAAVARRTSVVVRWFPVVGESHGCGRTRDEHRDGVPTGRLPGVPTAKDDPNSFGMRYEYSRTGERRERPRDAVGDDDMTMGDRIVGVCYILTLPFDVLCATHVATTL